MMMSGEKNIYSSFHAKSKTRSEILFFDTEMPTGKALEDYIQSLRTTDGYLAIKDSACIVTVECSINTTHTNPDVLVMPGFNVTSVAMVKPVSGVKIDEYGDPLYYPENAYVSGYDSNWEAYAPEGGLANLSSLTGDHSSDPNLLSTCRLLQVFPGRWTSAIRNAQVNNYYTHIYHIDIPEKYNTRGVRFYDTNGPKHCTYEIKVQRDGNWVSAHSSSYSIRKVAPCNASAVEAVRVKRAYKETQDLVGREGMAVMLDSSVAEDIRTKTVKWALYVDRYTGISAHTVGVVGSDADIIVDAVEVTTGTAPKVIDIAESVVTDMTTMLTNLYSNGPTSGTAYVSLISLPEGKKIEDYLISASNGLLCVDRDHKDIYYAVDHVKVDIVNNYIPSKTGNTADLVRTVEYSEYLAAPNQTTVHYAIVTRNSSKTSTSYPDLIFEYGQDFEISLGPVLKGNYRSHHQQFTNFKLEWIMPNAFGVGSLRPIRKVFAGLNGRSVVLSADTYITGVTTK